MVFTLGGADSKAFVLAQDARLPIDPRLKVVDPLTLGGTCLGTVRFAAATLSLVVAQDNRIGANGCTVSVLVQAQSPGVIQTTVPALLVKTPENATNREASATLVVTE